MPAALPFTVLALRHAEGTVPENRFWLALSSCSWFREDHSGGSVPVSVLLPTLMRCRFVLFAQVAGRAPVQAEYTEAQSTVHAAQIQRDKSAS